MPWKIEFDALAAKEFKKLDKHSQTKISDYLKNKVLKSMHPRDLGKALRYDYAQLWRYRVDKFRIICHIEDDALVVLVLRIGIRDKVYK